MPPDVSEFVGEDGVKVVHSGRQGDVFQKCGREEHEAGREADGHRSSDPRRGGNLRWPGGDSEPMAAPGPANYGLAGEGDTGRGAREGAGFEESPDEPDGEVEEAAEVGERDGDEQDGWQLERVAAHDPGAEDHARLASADGAVRRRQEVAQRDP